MTNELTEYIAAYVNEEIDRDHEITADTIRNAIDAFNGGAR